MAVRPSLYSPEAIRPEDLDSAELGEKLSRAEAEVAAAEHGTEEERRALRDKRRWEAFLRLAQGGSSSDH